MLCVCEYCCVSVHVHVCMIRPSQLNCLGSSAGKNIRLEHRRSWVQIPPEAAHFSLGVVCCGVLLCLSKSRVAMCTCTCTSIQHNEPQKACIFSGCLCMHVLFIYG